MHPYESSPGPEVTVTPIPLAEAGGDPIQAHLGQKELSSYYSGLLNLAVDRADAAYLLTWQGGNRVPRGVQLGSRVIAWTQHGRVLTEDGEHFGVYDRLKDLDGPSQVNEMVVLTFPERGVKGLL